MSENTQPETKEQIKQKPPFFWGANIIVRKLVREIGYGAFTLLCWYSSYANEVSDKAFPSQNRAIKELKASSRSIVKWKKTLVKYKLIIIDKPKRGGVDIIIINNDRIKEI